MTILLLLAVAVLAGLLVDARRRLAAERTRHTTEVALARAGWVAANERAGKSARLARELADRLAEAETITLVVTPREPRGDADPAAVTERRLRAVEGPEDVA